MVSSKARGRWAALLLAVVTPVVAEFTLGNPPLRQAYLLLLWVPIYGAGAVLVRELVRRSGRGWGAILLLGVAYGIVEEGLALQALTSPTLYGVAGWAPRVLGLNSAYTELNLPYHAVFSVALPILLLDLVFPGLRRQPYLGRAGLVAAGVVFVLGAVLLRLTVTAVIDPGYQAPPAVVIGCLLAVALLAVIALRLNPRRPGPPPVAVGPPPRPVLVGGFGGVVVFGYLALLFPFGGAEHPAFTRGGWVPVPMVAAAVLAVAAGWLLGRWTRGRAWGDRHSLALASGALVAHTVFGVIANGETVADRLSLAALGVVMGGLLAILGRRARIDIDECAAGVK
ncbi:hypothetical protein [Nonomuraea sp. NPDC050786]|uniref:hypothetical protein n=1 Tax=Nonomuraea sp. NPDC050786 TaxID=3154840 RepID=UPI0033D1EACF